MKENRTAIWLALAKAYPHPSTGLVFSGPFQLLIATILSAQCTDVRVNQITASLFREYPSVDTMVAAPLGVLESYLRSAGLYRTKARRILQVCKLLIDQHQGQVPPKREALMELPGVGRKTANVVLAVGFGIPAFPVDTHVIRLSNRLCLVSPPTESPLDIEKQLTEQLTPDDWIDGHHRLIEHGRNLCRAIKPICNRCSLRPLCPAVGKYQATP